MTYRILELYCGAGGSAEGYARAGFEVIGVDSKTQPRFPFRFIQADAIEFLEKIDVARYFDAIHASPPCQRFTSLRSMWNAKHHPDLLTPTRELLREIGIPYVIENVPTAPLIDPIILCGSMFGLGAQGAELRRHRHFEMTFPVRQPHCRHGRSPRVIGVYGGHGRDRRRTANTQDFSTESRRVAMGIDWMSGTELSQAIPPSYSEYLGRYLSHVLDCR